ncbi:MAG: hypothetical protein AB1400_01340 [Pseudomonadota bacterium]
MAALLGAIVCMPAFGKEGCTENVAELPISSQSDAMKACLERQKAHSDEQRRQEQLSVCEQNAKNMNIKQADKTAYLEACMRRNEVAVAKQQLEERKKEPAVLQQTFKSIFSTPGKQDAVARECQARAAQLRLTNKALENYLARCEKESAVKAEKEERLLALRKEREQRELDLKIQQEERALAGLKLREEKLAAARKKDELSAKPVRQAEAAVPSEGERQSDLVRYKIAGDELQSGKVEGAIWYKAFSEAGPDDKATQAAYIRLRVEQLRALGQTKPSEW